MHKVEKTRSFNIPIPSTLLLIAGVIGSLIRVVGFKAELNYFNARILTMQETISGETATKELSMPKTNMTNAILDAVNWFKENGYLCR